MLMPGAFGKGPIEDDGNLGPLVRRLSAKVVAAEMAKTATAITNLAEHDVLLRLAGWERAVAIANRSQ